MSEFIYIASPFFDERSVGFVEAKEEDLAAAGIEFFSPRKCGLDFSKLKDKKLRSDRIKTIFHGNIVNIKKCTKIICNLNYCNGSIDIGTLWELGYYIGTHDESDFKIEIYSKNEIRDLVLNLIDRISSYSRSEAYSGDKPNLIFGLKEQYDKFIESNKLLDLKVSPLYVELIQQSLPFLNMKNNIFVIDNLPIHLFVFMGCLYGRGIPYYTASVNDFGSNVMIAASSKGHMKIPTFTDDTYRDKIL